MINKDEWKYYERKKKKKWRYQFSLRYQIRHRPKLACAIHEKNLISVWISSDKTYKWTSVEIGPLIPFWTWNCLPGSPNGTWTWGPSPFEWVWSCFVCVNHSKPLHLINFSSGRDCRWNFKSYHFFSRNPQIFKIRDN